MATRRKLRKFVCLPPVEKKLTYSTYNNGSIVADFLGNATAHGFGKIYSATKVIARLFWILLFLVLIGVVVYNVMIMFSKLFSYDMVTSIETDIAVGGLQFPSVTLCNVDPHVLAEREALKKLKVYIFSYLNNI